MIVSMIAAMDRRRGIGLDNRLPWRLPADLRRFRALTMGHRIVVGRRTFESIGCPLPGRRTAIMTRDRDFRAEGCEIVHSVEEAVGLAKSAGEEELFICGGAQVYAQFMASADRLYLTMVEAEIAADTFFPEFDLRGWRELESSRHPADEQHQYSFTFRLLARADKNESAE